MIFLMGLFSIYTGLIYNDVFSRAFHMTPSSYKFAPTTKDVLKYNGKFSGQPYFFGIDPVWHTCENFLLFSNSYKMKMAIIFGVIHMSFGITLNILNFRNFNKKISIYIEFIPQLTFLMCMFGYLVILIFYKWFTDWSQVNLSPPGLLNTLIYMFLSPGTVKEDMRLYPGQEYVQVALVLIAVCCVPILLFAKPYAEYREHHKNIDAGYANVATNRTSIESSDGLSNVDALHEHVVFLIHLGIRF